MTTRLATQRVRDIAADLHLDVSNQGPAQIFVPSWCHSSNDKKSLSVGSHDSDATESADGYPLVTCHGGCDYPKVRAALVAHGVRPELLRSTNAAPAALPASKPSTSAPPPLPVPYVPQEVWLGMHDALLDNSAQLACLRRQKGLTEDTVRATCLGWDARTRRISVPVFDEDGRCVNLRLYKTNAKPTDDKMISYSVKGGPAYGRNRLYVPGEMLDPARRTIHCAGELDAILGWQHGWQTSTQTGGETSRFPDLELHRMRGLRLVIAYVNDEAGRTGSAKTAHAVARVAASVHVVDLGVLDVGDKGDMGDVWMRDDLGDAAVCQLLAEATPWATQETADNGWLSQDITAVLDGTHKPLQPTVCRRSGSGPALFYPGKTHALIADSEAGKTWLALFAAKQELDAGHNVFFYDFEDDATGVVGRLLAMGAGKSELSCQFHYVRPDGPLTEGMRVEWLAEHRRHSPTLVVVDGVTEAMSHHGWGQNDNAEIAKFYRTILTPMADLGAAVVVLDHLPKSDEKGRGAIGGVHKLNGIDGAMYRLKPVREIAPGVTGVSMVTIDKDRPGQVKRHQDKRKQIAEMIVDAEGLGDDVAVMLEIPGTTLGAVAEAVKPRPDQLKGHAALVYGVLRLDTELSTTGVINALNQGKQAVSSSSVKNKLRELEEMGLASREARTAPGKKVAAHFWRQIDRLGGTP